MSLGSLAQRISDIDGVDVARDVSAGSFCTYRVGGPLAVVAHVDNADALAELLPVLTASDVETLPIGKGSNLLVSDAGFGGVAILLGNGFAATGIVDRTVTAGGAASLPVVARSTVSAGLTGFEWAVGVPGSIGGAVRMNAGGHGSDMAASLNSVEVADLQTAEIHTQLVDALALGYRQSNLTESQLVISAELSLERAKEPHPGVGELKEIVSWRREHQPGGANAGSVFTNPPGDSAGRLIDAAGLKGERIGTAEVSPKHANFIQADADGQADDVMALMAKIVDTVDAVFGVRLHAETRLIGFAEKWVDHVQSAPNSGGQ